MNFSHYKKTLWLSYLLTLLVIGLGGMAAYISTRHFIRLDLTADRAFSIDRSTKSILRELPDIVTVKVFFSGELPPNLLAVRQHVEDTLQEFTSFADGNLQVRFFDPADEAVAEEARRLGIPPVRMNILSKDKFEVKSGFLGVAFMYGGRHEVIPVIETAQTLEYDFIASIAKLTRADVRSVGFLSGHNEYPIFARRGVTRGNGYVLANAALQKNYRTGTVTLESDAALAAFDTLIVGGPETPFTNREKLMMDQYLMNGGNLIFLIDSASVSDAYEATPLDVGLADMLAHYGAQVEPMLVLDELNETNTFESGSLSFMVPYPFWVRAVSDSFDQSHSIVRKLSAIVLPWASPLTVTEATEGRATPLVKTSPHAWLQEAPFNLDPSAQSAEGATGQHTLAVLLQGPFDSFFARGGRSGLSASSEKGMVLLVGNSRFLTDRMVREYEGNLNFLLNAVDFMTLGESLASIRPSAIAERPLIKLAPNERQLVKLLGVFLMPALVILYGALRSLDRKKKKITL